MLVIADENVNKAYAQMISEATLNRNIERAKRFSLARMLIRYEELVPICKRAKQFHKVSFEEHLREKHRNNRSNWPEKWRQLGKTMYPEMLDEILDLFLEDTNTVSQIAKAWLAKETGYSPSQIERRILHKARHSSDKKSAKNVRQKKSRDRT